MVNCMYQNDGSILAKKVVKTSRFNQKKSYLARKKRIIQNYKLHKACLFACTRSVSTVKAELYFSSIRYLSADLQCACYSQGFTATADVNEKQTHLSKSMHR